MYTYQSLFLSYCLFPVHAKKLFCGEKSQSTYDDDDKVEPAPGVCEILLEAVSHHLDDHLKDEDDGERTVGVV